MAEKPVLPGNKQQDNNSKAIDSDSPNVASGNKIIEIQKKIENLSEEEAAKDADQWRNEG